jgi:hypothetical protein
VAFNEIIALILLGGAISLPIVLVPTFFHYRHERRKMDMEHAKSMRAIDLGRPLPGERPEDSWSSPARIGLLIGVVVPLSAFLCSAVATVAAGFHEGMWIATGLVGLGGVISGSILVGVSYSNAGAASRTEEAKPYVEEDAYDVVSARG